MTVDLHLGDCLDVLKGMEANSFDGVLTDPPYGLSFMSKAWDYGVPSAEVWAEVLRVCKPGAMLLAFGGSRTFHRLTCAIEDAGWEVRDVVCWLYGSGFPKSHDISKGIDKAAGITEWQETRPNPSWRSGNGPNATTSTGWQKPQRPPKPIVETAAAQVWQGYGTALKPAWEPCIVAMKPTDGTFANNAAKWKIAGLNVDGCRIPTSDDMSRPACNGRHMEDRPWVARRIEAGEPSRPATPDSGLGRWPANLLLDAEAAAALDQMSGERKAGVAVRHNGVRGGTIGPPGNKAVGTPDMGYGDTGGASRFFYTAKASRREREAGLEGLPERETQDYNLLASTFRTDPRSPNGGYENKPAPPGRNHHPCIKPLALCEYLARLILPPAAYRDTARLLVPFCGSGSEMIGALQAGWRNVEGIEKEAEYVEIARRRLDWWQRQLRGNPRPLPDWIEADELEPEDVRELAAFWPDLDRAAD